MADDVKQKIFDIANIRGYEIITMETDKDHIHILLSYDTTDSVCDIVKIVKVMSNSHETISEIFLLNLLIKKIKAPTIKIL